MTPEIQSTTSTVDGTEEQDPNLADVPSIFDEGTFVLVGCGAAKRDPEDPVDVHEAVVGPDEPFGQDWTAETGPAWKAKDLYTSTYFGVKRDFAEMATQWARQRDGEAWAILSAEHYLLRPWEAVKPYDTTVDDIGDDYTNDDHLADFAYERRPDGKALVTQLDKWALMVAVELQRWLTQFDEAGASPHGSETLRNLIVLAGKDYVEPLRERGAFDGLGNIRDGHHGIQIEPTFLFEEIEAGGIGEQMAWMSDAMSQVEERQSETEQATFVQTDGGRNDQCCETATDQEGGR